MVLRQEFAKQKLIRLQEDNIYAKKIILPALKIKRRRRILVQTELFMGIFMSSTRNSSSNVRSNCVFTSNYQQHLSGSYKQQQK